MTRKAKFSTRTKRLLAANAGHKCSLPLCNRSTSGPDNNPNKSISNGDAAHIYSASPSGPRGQSFLTPKQLEEEINGIWVCTNHHRVIDANSGSSFPVSTVIQYKELHLARIKQEQRGVAVEHGWIDHLRLLASPFFRTPEIINFGKITCLVGNMATGKSLICEIVAGFSSSKDLNRLGKFKTHSISEIQYFTPMPHLVTHSNQSSQTFKYYRDGRLQPASPIDIMIISPKRLDSPEGYMKPDLELFSILLGIPEPDIVNLTGMIDQYGTGEIANMRFDDDGETLYLDLKGTAKNLPFGVLSSSERIRVLVECSILAAASYHEQRPVILCLDCGLNSLDDTRFNSVLEKLSSQNIHFQTIITSFPRKLFLEDSSLLGKLNLVQLHGDRSDITIHQTQEITI